MILQSPFHYDWSAILGIWDLNVPTLTLNPVIELNCIQLISLIYTERQKTCTTFSFDFFWIEIDDYENQCSIVFMPVQKTIVVEKNKVCVKSCLHFYEKNVKS